MRELACDPIGDERMHVAGGVQPAVRKLRPADARVPNEFAEVCFDAGSLRQAHEVRDYGHAGILLVATCARCVTSASKDCLLRGIAK